MSEHVSRGFYEEHFRVPRVVSGVTYRCLALLTVVSQIPGYQKPLGGGKDR